MKSQITQSFQSASSQTKRAAWPLALGLALSGAWLVHTPLLASEMDDRIDSAAKKSFVFKTFLSEDSIKVESKDGIVTLTGTVSEDSHKLLAQETVNSLPGVIRVDNQIKIKDTPPKRSDLWLALKVKSALAFHRNVSGYDTQVDVREGVATLRGEASSLAQKELTTEHVRDVDGIEDVKNEMTVAALPPKVPSTLPEIVDDASITAQVHAALSLHRSTSSYKTTVTTENGVVTLAGGGQKRS
jgi:hyperosmotically inducible protein